MDRPTRVLSCFLAGLLASLLIYRLLLHPLNRFPGPLGARVSDLFLSARLARRHDMHRQSLGLYNEYGPFVRVGSSTLMLNHPLAVQAIHGPESGCYRASMYDFEQPNRGIATRDVRQHAARRRVWSRGFGDRALRGYEDRIVVYVRLLLTHLSAHPQGVPVDAARLTEHFAFDVLGDLALGQDFGMLRNGQSTAVEQLVRSMEIMGLRLPTWLLRMMMDVAQPLVTTEASTGFLAFCHENLRRLMADEARLERPGLMAPLLAHHEKLSPGERDMSVLQNDCRFAIIAGSDTVAATLAFVLFHIARHPEHTQKLRDELARLRDDCRDDDGIIAHKRLVNAEHLNAVINETLRLHPPASTILRVTPPEGIVVAGTFVPGDMTVFSSQYVIGRSEAVYEKAAEFVPERWYSRPEMIKEPAGYAPFSTGHHGCLGRPLALMEMRLLVAACVSRYNVTFAPGFDGDAFMDNVKDCMSWHMGKLELCFTEWGTES
ncbi:cytochrome P450 [Colletotrichum navitas]|uniref:Cytochrome P450 n=1 Tax=Colletotrichum navitas TaxID=681940 RepID=A0AAD8V345_9PEZI|nr:cytochrome P450 [Colletotrichum navitas]KAK1585488.1 cytochrome P450 [Colletotrichum navitas]